MSLREAAKKALEALEITTAFVDGCPIDWGRGYVPEADEAITTLRTALAEAEAEEPVAWFESPYGDVRINPLYKFQFPSSLLSWQIPLFAHPPRREPLAEEPVAWYSPSGEGYDSSFRDHSTVVACDGGDWSEWIPLYTRPPRREPLTEEQIAAVRRELDFSGVIFMTTAQCKQVVRIVEKAHGIGGDE